MLNIHTSIIVLILVYLAHAKRHIFHSATARGSWFKLQNIPNLYIEIENPKPQPSFTLINTDLLIPGLGAPITQASLLFNNENGTIIYSGSQANAPIDLNITEKLEVPVIMPGMWDVHTHYGGGSCSQISTKQEEFHDLAGGYFPHAYSDFGCALAMLKESLCAGVTSVRELGGFFGQGLRPLVDSGMYPAPHFHYGSKAIGMTGGHADIQELPIAITRRDYDDRYEMFGALCDGPYECIKRVREQIRAQSDVIKIMTSGGVLSAFDQPTDQELSAEEVRAIVQEAARADRSCAAHAHGERGIAVAVYNGVKTLEHGSYLNTTLAQAVKDHDMIYVPTITITQSFNQSVCPPQYDQDQFKKGQEVLIHNSASVRLAIKTGITIATGTDCPGNCAMVGQEINYLKDYFGMSELEAIQAGTAHGPLTLGKLAPFSGQLAAGYVADILVLNNNPLEKLAILKDPDEITHVFKAGKLLKSPQNELCLNVATNPPDMMWMPKDL